MKKGELMSKKTKITLIFLVFLLIIGIGIFGYAYYQGKINLKAATMIGQGDTSPNAVIYGGVSSVAQLQQKLAQGAGPNPAGGVYAPYQSPGHLQLLFHTLGIWENQFETLQDGVVYKDGRVVVGNTVVGTNAISSGRTDFGQTVDVTYMDGYNIYWRRPSVSFIPETLSALVFNNGSTVYAITKNCGNVIRANPVGPPPSEVAIEKIERNITKGETNWVKETKANPGDTIEYQINYATSGTNNNVIVYDALGEPTNLMNRQYLDYVSGGTYYPNGLNIKGYIAPRMVVFSLGNLPSGSKGHVNFRVKVKANTPSNTKICNSAAIISDQVNGLVSNNVCMTITVPSVVTNFTVSKTVSLDGSHWYQEVTAKPGVDVFYRIIVKNTGTKVIKGLMAQDKMPTRQTYISNSTYLFNASHPSGTKIGNNLVNTGENVGNYNPGASCTIIFKVKLDATYPVGTSTMTNVGGAIADNITKWDNAKVIVHILKPAEITKSKHAINVTQGGVNAETVKAHAGDVIRYTLTTKNTGELPAKDYVVKDNIADILQYSDVTSTGGGIVTNGEIAYPALDIAAGQTVNKTFEVTIKPEKDWPISGDLVMTNVYGNIVNVPVGFIEIVLSKTAFNETQGVDATITPAKAGDVIKYTLTTKNIGNEVKQDYIVKDDLADIMQYANVTDVGGGTIKGNVISWPKVDIKPDQTITKTFKVTVKPESAWSVNGDFVMTNVYGNTINVPIQPPTPPAVPTPTGVLGASTGGVKGLAVTGTALNIIFGLFILIASTYLYFRQKILLRLAILSI